MHGVGRCLRQGGVFCALSTSLFFCRVIEEVSVVLFFSLFSLSPKFAPTEAFAPVMSDQDTLPGHLPLKYIGSTQHYLSQFRGSLGEFHNPKREFFFVSLGTFVFDDFIFFFVLVIPKPASYSGSWRCLPQ